MDRKFFRGRTDFKQNGQPGEFKAIFATLNVKDADGDVTLPGAFEEGQAVRISAWGHKWDQLPVGRGTIHSDGKEAWVDGQFLLETETGKEHYNTVKGMGDLQEWSFGYQVEDSIPGQFDGQNVRFLRKLAVVEVSPVMQGAGVDTRTADIKADNGETKAGRVMAARNVERLRSALADLTEILKDAGLLETAASDSASDGDDGATDKSRKATTKEPQSSTLAARVAMELLESNISEER